MAQRAGVTFELERLDLDGDELVVSGHWSGVRGLRFVRPTLVADDRRILATLEHKPWAPSLDRAWTAAFPWEGDDVDVGGLALAVSPQVTVPLDGAAVSLPEPQPAPAAKTEAEAEGPGGRGRRRPPSRAPEPELAPKPKPKPNAKPRAKADEGEAARRPTSAGARARRT